MKSVEIAGGARRVDVRSRNGENGFGKRVRASRMSGSWIGTMWPWPGDADSAPSPDSRYILLPVVLHHLHMHLQEQKDLIMCARILSNVFCLIKKNSSVSTHRPPCGVPIPRLLERLMASE